MRETSERLRDGNILPAIAAVFFAIAVAAVALLMWKADTGKDIGAWIKDYQETLIGIPTVLVAWWAAVKLVEQISIMNAGNTTAARSLDLEERRFKLERKEELIALREVTHELQQAVLRARTEILECPEETAQQIELAALVREFRRYGVKVNEHEPFTPDEMALFEGILGSMDILTPAGKWQCEQFERFTGGVSKFLGEMTLDLNTHAIERFKKALRQRGI
jgi:hypothetical protein